MAARWGIVSASVALSTALGVTTPAAGTQTGPRSLTVVIHNDAAIPATVLQQARAIATAIYRAIGVELDWWDPSHPGTEVTDDPAAPSAWPAAAIHVRLIGDSPDLRRRISARELGFAASGATLATVLVKLLDQLAGNKRLNVGELLGVVIAHEVGHLLLPPNSHTAGGLMSPDLDLFRLEHGGVWFDEHQAALIRARVAWMSEVGEQ
jgi:hypothetical protein